MAYEEGKAELDILKEHLDMGKPQDYIAYRNVELELLCKTGADRSKLEENVRDTLAYIRNSKMPDRNRCMFEASVARVIWSLRLNPVHILQALNADKELIRQLPMPARYHCYKNIQSFFEDLHGDIVAQYADLWKDAKSIIKNIVGQSIWCRLSNMPHGCIGIIWLSVSRYVCCMLLMQLRQFQQRMNF